MTCHLPGSDTDTSVSDSDDGLPDMSARMTWMRGPTRDFSKLNLAEAGLMGTDMSGLDHLRPVGGRRHGWGRRMATI